MLSVHGQQTEEEYKVRQPTIVCRSQHVYLCALTRARIAKARHLAKYKVHNLFGRSNTMQNLVVWQGLSRKQILFLTSGCVNRMSLVKDDLATGLGKNCFAVEMENFTKIL